MEFEELDFDDQDYLSESIDFDTVRSVMVEFLKAVVENPDREGLKNTPARVARMYGELLAGYSMDPKKIINGALFNINYDEMVLVRDIEFYSLCEHHMLPFIGRAHVAYLPAGKVIGLSCTSTRRTRPRAAPRRRAGSVTSRPSSSATTRFLGISTDSMESHLAFRDKHKLPFPLLSDEDATVSRQFGVYKQRNLYGKKYIGIERTTFVIDRTGRIAQIYPKDDTPGCTQEACGFRDLWGEIEALGAVVLGVSPDSGASHQRFATKHGLPFTLLSDPDHGVMEAYGAWGEKTLYGKKSMGVIRSTVWIGPGGPLAGRLTSRIKAQRAVPARDERQETLAVAGGDRRQDDAGVALSSNGLSPPQPRPKPNSRSERSSFVLLRRTLTQRPR